MKKIVVILVCVLLGANIMNAQVKTSQDESELSSYVKDSLRKAYNAKVLQKKKDSFEKARIIRLEQSKKRRDSMAQARRIERERMRGQNKEYVQRKKNRQEFIDSINIEREKALEERKAYRKYLKSKEYKQLLLAKKKEQESDNKTKTFAVEKERIRKVKDNKKEVVKNDTKTPEVKASKNSIVQNKYNDIFSSPLPMPPPDPKSSFFGVKLAMSSYLGDLGGNSGIGKNFAWDFNFNQTSFFYGLSYTHLRKEAVGLRLSYVFGNVKGSDQDTYYKDASDPAFNRFKRNLDFKTKISELSLMAEIHPLKFFNYQKEIHHKYFQPYVLLGIGRYSFNPQGSYFDPILADYVWVDLAPLRTEGQGMAEYPDRLPYDLTQWNLLYGFGWNYEVTPSVQIGFEFVGRKLFTDYLDDVSTTFIDPNLFDNYLDPFDAEIAKFVNNKSQLIDASKPYKEGSVRGISSNNDTYFSFAARMTIKLNRIKLPSLKRRPQFKYDDSEICD